MQINETKKYFLGIPYSSIKEENGEKVIRTFFKTIKKVKTPDKTTYYFLGIKLFTKKKSKLSLLIDNSNSLTNNVNILTDKLEKLQLDILNLQNLQNNTNNELSEIRKRLTPPTVTPHYENILHINIPPEHKILEYMHLYKYYDRCLPRILGYISEQFEDFKLIDVGANIGDTAQNLRLAGLNFPILAIEGNDEYFNYLEQNQHIIKNIDICKVLLSDKEETINAKLNSQNGTAGFVKSNESSQVLPLDTLLESFQQYKNSKLLKIDTDGFDNIILKGASNYINNAKPIIYMEYDPNFLIKNNNYGLDIFKYLHSLGYNNAIMYQNFGEYMCSFNLDNEEFISEMRDFFYKNNRICYADLLLFNNTDLKLFEEVRNQERNYFKSEKL